ncbi:phosphoglycerate kinase [Candidatus Woesearchaeota archaeon]|nr:phosphoglycerate kinase [Candidatus Woesearchaeota archaeon]
MLKSVTKAKLKNKRVLLRVDFNVPLKNGFVSDDSRIHAAIPTIKTILKQKPVQLIIMAHLGRPGGKVVRELRMDPIAKRLEKLLKQKVVKLDDYTTKKDAKNKVLMLENLRFFKGEEKNDVKFAKTLASVADVYVNDAFGVCHRKHASVHAITKYLPLYAGLLLLSEIEHLQLKKPARPFIALIGGAKVSTKIPMIEQLLKKADAVLVGGAMIFTFYRAMGLSTGKSIVEKKYVSLAKKMLFKAKGKIVLPTDIVIASKAVKGVKTKNVSVGNIPNNMIGLDIGSESTQVFNEILKSAKTVFFNGPMGLFEVKPFDKATNELAKTIANSRAKSIVGGGDSLAAIKKLKLEKKFSHISTGGGASIALIEGKKLPGIEALKR